MSKSIPKTPAACESCFITRQLLQSMPFFWYVINQKGSVLQASDTLLRAFHAHSVESIRDTFYTQWAKHLYWLEPRVVALQSADQAAFTLPLSHAVVLEPPVTDARGLVFYYEAQRVLLYNTKHHIVGLLVGLIDVTTREVPTTLVKTRMKTKNPPYPPGITRDMSIPPYFLIVEDNPIARRATEHVLTTLDCKVDLATQETEVAHFFQPGKYDAIFMDLSLEGTSGYLLAKQIRRIEKGTGYCVPIIALTRFDLDLVKTDCDYYLMEGAINKPLNIEQARQVIQRYVYQVPLFIQGFRTL